MRALALWCARCGVPATGQTFLRGTPSNSHGPGRQPTRQCRGTRTSRSMRSARLPDDERRVVAERRRIVEPPTHQNANAARLFQRAESAPEIVLVIHALEVQIRR